MKKFLLFLLIALAALAGFIATRPAEWRLVRSTTIEAPPAVVFANLDDFRRWEAWSPWEKLDPNLKRTFEGPSSGVGASYHWIGNENVGEGRMTITESRAPGHLAIRLEFIAPFAATNETVFTLAPDIAETTSVDWAMSGRNNFVAKAMGLVTDVDALVGADFEQGLGALKEVSEAQAVQAADAQRAAAAAAAAPESAPPAGEETPAPAAP